MNRNVWIFIAFLAASGFALLSLQALRDLPHLSGRPADPMVLRVHDVPPARADDIRLVLSDSLSMGDGQVPQGRVSKAGSGQLVVLAPEPVQADLAKAITRLGGAKSNNTVPATVVLDLWSIDALPRDGADDPSLAPLAAALDATRAVLGPVRFQRDETLSITVRADGNPISAATDGELSVMGNLRSYDGGVSASLAVRDPSISVTLDLPFGQPTVLAQIGTKDGRTRLLVARARPADARG